MIRSLRALVWLRLKLLRNSLGGTRRRDTLEQVSRIFAVMVPLIIAALAVGSIVALGVLGVLGGRAITSGQLAPATGLFLVRTVLFAMTALVVVFAVSSPAQTALSRYTRLLILPIERRVLHLVEVLAHLADPWLLSVAVGMSGFAIGLAAGHRPKAAVVAAAAGVAMLAVLMSLGGLVGFLTTWLLRSRRRGELFTLFFVLAITLVSLLPAYFSKDLEERDRRGGRSSITEIDRRLPRWALIVPSELYGRTLRAAFEADKRRAVLGCAGLVVQAGLLFAASSLVHRRLLNSLEGSRSSRRSDALVVTRVRLPLLSPTASAIAWVQARTALRSVRGRLAVLLPGPMVAMMALVFSRLDEDEQWLQAAVQHGHLIFGAAIVFCLVSVQPFAMNAFGSDRSGLTLQLLSPVADRDLAWGKVAGVALVLAAAVGIALVAAVASSPTGSPLLWLSILVSGLAAFVLISPVSIWLSAMFPVAADLSKSGSGGNPHPLPALVGTVLVMLLMAPGALAVVAAEFWWQSPARALLISGIWLAIAAGASWPLMSLASRIVGRRRENMGLVAQGR